ncbi:MAG TPA: dTDP-glucose 4,6-dehydratase [Longimicrobiales bacterium]|nr:dTDP-glucose 4,6-dehydratase [Longimicrobiales bacterium]
MRRVLLTGGAGFVGANLAHFWRRRHPEDLVVVMDALTYAGNRGSLAGLDADPGFEFVHADIRDRPRVEEVLRTRRIDVVVHLAAESHVDRSILGPDAFVQTNVVGTQRLLDAARAVWLDSGSGVPHRFHHVSTDEVYGSLALDDPPFTEATPFAPNSPYSASKAGADHLVRAYHRTYGLETTTTHSSNNYGAYQFPEKLIPLCLLNALQGLPLPIYGDGGNVRDWLFVEDHCRAIEAALERGSPGERYNVGGGDELSNLELVRCLCAALDASFRDTPGLEARFPEAPAARGRPTASLIRFVADRPGHDLRYAIDASKAVSELGFRPETSLPDGLARAVGWYLEHEPWWRGIQDGSYRLPGQAGA